jgi:hypothetical protein
VGGPRGECEWEMRKERDGDLGVVRHLTCCGEKSLLDYVWVDAGTLPSRLAIMSNSSGHGLVRSLVRRTGSSICLLGGTIAIVPLGRWRRTSV